MYPRFLYHKEEAPSGKLIRSAADEPTGEGWVDTPQKFDPKYVDPPKLVPDGSVPADRPGYIPKAYPSFRYGASGETQIVSSAEADAALNPADWKHSPADFLPKTNAPVMVTPLPPAPPVVIDPLNPPPELPVSTAPPMPTLPAEPPQLSAAKQKAALYAAPVAQVIANVKTMSDIEKLQMVKGFEETNPSKRVTVIKAVDARLAELGYVPPAA